MHVPPPTALHWAIPVGHGLFGYQNRRWLLTPTICLSIQLFVCERCFVAHTHLPQQLMNPNSPVKRFHIGSHWAQQEGPLLVFRPSGIITLGDNQDLFAHMERIKQDQKRLYILLDACHGAQQDPKGRAWGAKNVTDANRPAGVAIIRASFQARVLLGLFVRAAQLVNRFNVPLEFFSTETEAREFLAGLDAAFVEERSRPAP